MPDPLGLARRVTYLVGAWLAARWPTTAVIAPGEVWDHKGIEYDGVVVLADGMTLSEVYLAASRAAHEQVVVTASGS